MYRKLRFASAAEYPLPGKLLFSDLTVDPGTGQIVLRSELTNPDLDLLPGSFVRIRLKHAIDQRGISVPQRSILRNSAGRAQVLLVDDELGVSQKTVELGAAIHNRWIVTDGLKSGDRIIVDGLQHARSGEKVMIDNAPLSPDLASDQ